MSLSVGWSVGHSYCQLASVQDGKFVTLAVGKINSWSTSKLIKKIVFYWIRRSFIPLVSQTIGQTVRDWIF